MYVSRSILGDRTVFSPVIAVSAAVFPISFQRDLPPFSYIIFGPFSKAPYFVQ